jgi:UDP-glucuronate decarboxylase
MMQSKEVGPMNIGNAEEHRIEEVADMIIKLAKGRAEIRSELPLPYTMKQAIPSIRMAREALGWFPVVGLQEGLQRTIDYMRGGNQAYQYTEGEAA